MTTTSNPYRGFRFPPEIINRAVWLYPCFSLSLREVELILAARGIQVSYETIREDLERVAERNRLIQRVNRIIKGVEDDVRTLHVGSASECPRRFSPRSIVRGPRRSCGRWLPAVSSSSAT